VYESYDYEIASSTYNNILEVSDHPVTANDLGTQLKMFIAYFLGGGGAVERLRFD
jgi:hypothetical protein